MAKNASLIRFLEAGLKAAGMRHAAIANNLANLRTPGYRRWDVKFEQLLARQMDSSIHVDLSEAMPRLVRPMAAPAGADGNDVDMETEIGEMIKNSGKYKTYMRILHKVYQQMREAMRTEG
jgi:flagellar basal-body rod protein FlgB